MSRILSIGKCCVDIVNFVNKYPEEDSDQRCNKQSWERGGNASNVTTVLSQLGLEVELFGMMADDSLLRFLQEDLASYSIKYMNCPVSKLGKTPTSVVLCSEESGSRTIVHSNGNLPELSTKDFEEKIDLDSFNWIHFEGRNESETPKMLEKIRLYNKDNNFKDCDNENLQEFDNEKLFINYLRKKLPVSIEVEKRRESLFVLLKYADVAVIGKDFASMKGANNCIEAVEIFAKSMIKGSVIVCPWGEDGAAYGVAGFPNYGIHKVNALPPTQIVDSLGAGDTFCSGVIYGMSKGFKLKECIEFACRLAEAKLEIYGFKGLKNQFDSKNYKNS